MTSKPLVVLAIVLTAVNGCGSSDGDSPTAAASVRVERCVDRLLSRAVRSPGDEESARAYARTTYCERFERNGWVYVDGALRIAAQKWLEEGGTCEVGTAEEPARTVPCAEFEDRQRLDCALLHHVRRSEVRGYLAELRREGDVACDDGTPLAELGVP